MGSKLPQAHSSTIHPPPVATPVKQPGSLPLGVAQQDGCPYGSPISGVCTTAPATRADPALSGSVRMKLHLGASSTTTRVAPVQPGPGTTGSPGSRTVQQHADALTGRTSSMPELWQAASWSGRSTPMQQCGDKRPQQQHTQQMRLSADNMLRRDQDVSFSSQLPSPCSSQHSLSAVQQHYQQPLGQDTMASDGHPVEQPLLPVDVLLAPLLPSADEAKLVDRLSQLRHALDEHRQLAAGWEQQVGAALKLGRNT